MTNTTESTVIERMLDELEAEVTGYMGLYHKASEIVPRLSVYCDAISYNFVPWMASAWTGCESEVARRVCRDNLECEVAEDHSNMLRRYVAQIPGDIVYLEETERRGEALETVLHYITALTPNSIDGLLVMAGLENASLVFIPEMKRWGQILKFADFEYVDKHGVANVQHANEFRQAVEAEAEFRGIRLSDLEQYPTLRYVSDLLQGIFA